MKETLEGITQKVTTAITQKVTTVTSFNTSRDGGLGASKGVAAVGKKTMEKSLTGHGIIQHKEGQGDLQSVRQTHTHQVH